MDRRLVGEFMATLILIFLGDGVNANVLLAKSAAENSGWIVITTGWALAVMAGVFAAIACGSPDAHINPAVTLAFDIVSSDYSKLVPYAIAQVLGAVAGSRCRGNARLVTLSPPLGSDARRVAKTRVLLHDAQYPQHWSEPA
jgi:glycerol uptake facilitator protein